MSLKGLWPKLGDEGKHPGPSGSSITGAGARHISIRLETRHEWNPAVAGNALSVLIATRSSQGRLSRRFHKERDCFFLQEEKRLLWRVSIYLLSCGVPRMALLTFTVVMLGQFSCLGRSSWTTIPVPGVAAAHLNCLTIVIVRTSHPASRKMGSRAGLCLMVSYR